MEQDIIYANSKSLMSSRCYHIINFSFISIILGIILYSLVFPYTYHTVPAFLTQVTGIVPPSKGLSAAFAEIVRGNINNALALNQYSLKVFSFFIIQLLTRILVSISIRGNWISISKVIVFDVLYSILIFLYCFAPFIGYTIKLFGELFK